jgi:hypothetical protein
MRRSRAATTADDADAVDFDELLEPFGEFRRRKRKMSPAFDHLRQTRIGHDAELSRAGSREIANVLAHLLRAGGAVQADDVHVGVGFDRRQGRGDVCADQHRAGRLHRYGGHQRRVAASLLECHADRMQDAFGLEYVLAGFDDHHIGAALEQAARLGVVAVEELVVADLPQRDELGAWSH